MDIWGQDGADVRLEWGAEGVAELGRGCAVLVIVDVLSFSTTVDLVLGRDVKVLPVRWRDQRGSDAAKAAGATLAGEGAWTLRPSSVTKIPAGTLLALPSPNGATLCAAAATTGARVLAGCLRNVTAVAAAAHRLAEGGPIGVIPAGERWGIDLLSDKGEFGPLRPAVEDQLGAGAIAAALAAHGRSLSAEAALAAAAFGVTDLSSALTHCASGRELAAAGHGNDVTLAAEHDVSRIAPALTGGVLAPA
ncbi:2-phosphosulfolactate phosphatase [Amycolatopsis sp. H20-H5]|uniref:2-phosphosulfolactate phosphatase n=1 Tax=Amycolatopsis sp. H20-H5 TaxID=3046309 RepID=UPI002DBF7C6D|nr:2-phosphosulfolactate phosphatase [Amycolatopsis sp. H20-H5]MEC3978452.1 2-phosphosulfolactate phosphatase [Amycolatopsis sp. H20-H5]